ncbi:MAG: hypothetical protein M0Z75_05090 [Nitrospiraceae bacterium]|nr:hypothetical protein [Nitrospiraceae bacterium]
MTAALYIFIETWKAPPPAPVLGADVREYGADCYGGFDSTKAIQAAVDSSRDITISGGCTFLVSSPIRIEENRLIFGAGRNAVIKWAGSKPDEMQSPLFLVKSGRTLRLENIKLIGQGHYAIGFVKDRENVTKKVLLIPHGGLVLSIKITAG